MGATNSRLAGFLYHH